MEGGWAEALYLCWELGLLLLRVCDQPAPGSEGPSR